MPHSRQRFLLPTLLKRLKISPVVAIQGARQTGKSFLARELLKPALPKMIYQTLDKKSDRDFAINNPDSFVAQFDLKEQNPIVIDEAQKAPPLFDAIKANVDEFRRPGRFILLGSTEFSLRFKIRESLTGRMSNVRLFPLTLAETRKFPHFQDWKFSRNEFKLLKLKNNHQTTRAELLKYLDRGGMPGIFSIRESEVRQQFLNDWLELTVQRDIHQIPKLKLDSQLAQLILEKIAQLPEPSTSEIIKSLKIDNRRVKNHLQALASLFVISSINPIAGSSGSEHWYLLDCAFVKTLGGNFKRQLQTWFFNEIQVRNSMRISPRKIQYYRTPKGRIIDFILTEGNENVAIQIFENESITDPKLNLLRSFGQKFPNTLLLALSGGNQNHPLENLYVRPWEYFG
jgi:predicted AAA+ superfamily ATPase